MCKLRPGCRRNVAISIVAIFMMLVFSAKQMEHILCRKDAGGVHQPVASMVQTPHLQQASQRNIKAPMYRTDVALPTRLPVRDVTLPPSENGGLMTKRLPHAICIGSKKSGTGTLMKFLALNPYINAQQREVHFFDKDERYMKGLEYYRKQMPAGKPYQLTMVKTPKYFVHEPAGRRIHAMNSSIKLIVILRDPVKRLISDYDHEKQLPNQPILRVEKTYSLQQLVYGADGGLNMTYEPTVASMYDLHLDRWLNLFPRNQILVLDGERFIKDPLPALRQCEDFLGIPNIIDESMFVLEETGYYCVKTTGCPKRKGRVHPVYPEEFLDRLRTLYAAPHVSRLFNIIGEWYPWKTAEFITA